MDYKTVQTAMAKRAAADVEIEDKTPTFFGGKPFEDFKLYQKPGGLHDLWSETINRVTNPPMLASRTPYYDARVAATNAAASKYKAFKSSFDPKDFKKEDGEAIEGVPPTEAVSTMAPAYFDINMRRRNHQPEPEFVDHARKEQAEFLAHGFISPEGTTQYTAAKDYLYNAGKLNEQEFKAKGRVPVPEDDAPYGDIPTNLTPDQQKRLMILRHSMGATQKPGRYSNLS